jgi:hypothetical protein
MIKTWSIFKMIYYYAKIFSVFPPATMHIFNFYQQEYSAYTELLQYCLYFLGQTPLLGYWLSTQPRFKNVRRQIKLFRERRRQSRAVGKLQTHRPKPALGDSVPWLEPQAAHP